MPCTPASTPPQQLRVYARGVAAPTAAGAWPAVPSAGAPRWRRYLRSVYGDDANVSVALVPSLRWFWWWAPDAAARPLLERAVWFPKGRPAGEAWVPGTKLERHLAKAGFFVDHGDERQEAAVRDGEWVEVMRVAHETRVERNFRAEQSRADQIWYFRARGSGIWWNAGATLAVRDRSALVHAFASRLGWEGVLPLRACEVAPQDDSGESDPYLILHGQLSLCEAARLAKLDTIQITHAFGGRRYELIDCRASGAAPPPLWGGACPPAAAQLHLRHGAPPALQPCACDRSLPFLNCGACVRPAAVQYHGTVRARIHVARAKCSPPLPLGRAAPSPPARLGSRSCAALLRNRSHLFGRMWSVLGRRLARPHAAGSNCWDRGPGYRMEAEFFTQAAEGRRCATAAWGGGVWNESATPRRPALLGLDRDIRRTCRPTAGGGDACAARRISRLAMGASEHNLCRSLEWLACAASDRLPAQAGLMLASPAAGFRVEWIGNCSQPGAPRRGAYAFTSNDVYALELCLLNEMCANGESLFSARVGDVWRCDFSADRFRALARLLLRPPAPAFTPLHCPPSEAHEPLLPRPPLRPSPQPLPEGSGCDAAFPVDLSNRQCHGLRWHPNASSAEACARWCCAAADCHVWQWCPPPPPAPSAAAAARRRRRRRAQTCADFSALAGRCYVGVPSKCTAAAAAPASVGLVSRGRAAAAAPGASRLPCFANAAALRRSRWGAYLRSVYGSTPVDGAAFPWCVEQLWVLHPARLRAAGLEVAPPATPCDEAAAGRAFVYSEPTSSYSLGFVLWVHHPTRPPPLPSGAWVEAMHCVRGGCVGREEAVRMGMRPADWSHDYARSVTSEGRCVESEGRWMYYAPGSGVWVPLGATRAFDSNAQAVRALLHRGCAVEKSVHGFSRRQGVQCTADFEALVLAARASGLETLQFLGHPDQRCGRMRVELLDVRAGASGRFTPRRGACGEGPLRAGWRGDEACECDTAAACMNCRVVRGRELPTPTPPTPPLAAAAECTLGALPPPVFRAFSAAATSRLGERGRLCEVNVRNAQLAELLVGHPPRREYAGLAFDPAVRSCFARVPSARVAAADERRSVLSAPQLHACGLTVLHAVDPAPRRALLLQRRSFAHLLRTVAAGGALALVGRVARCQWCKAWRQLVAEGRLRHATCASGGGWQWCVAEPAPPRSVCRASPALLAALRPAAVTITLSRRGMDARGEHWRYFTALPCASLLPHLRRGAVCLVFSNKRTETFAALVAASSEGTHFSEEALGATAPFTTRLYASWGPSSLVHNLAVLRVGDRLLLVGGVDGLPSQLFLAEGSQWSFEKPKRGRLRSFRSKNRRFHFPPNASWPHAPGWRVRPLLNGSHPGCVSQLAGMTTCLFDGRLSLVAFHGRFLLYTRANPALFSERWVQVTISRDLWSWDAFQMIQMRGYSYRQGNVYFFAVQVNPADNQTLVALFPLEHLSEGCVGLAISRDGVVWSEVRTLLQCPEINFRDESHPAAGLILDAEQANVMLYIQSNVPLISLDNEDGKGQDGELDDPDVVATVFRKFPYLRRNDSRIWRFIIPMETLREWTVTSLNSLRTV